MGGPGCPNSQAYEEGWGSHDSPPIYQHPPWIGVSSPNAVLSITDQLTIPLESPGHLACLPSPTIDQESMNPTREEGISWWSSGEDSRLPKQGALGSMPGQGTIPHMLQRRVHTGGFPGGLVGKNPASKGRRHRVSIHSPSRSNAAKSN